MFIDAVYLDPSIRNKRIIVAPLCWGLGHAARCVPIINQLIKQENEITIASDNEALDLLRLEFPNLNAITLPAYDVTYNHKSMLLNMLLQAPKILSTIRAERKSAESLAKEHNIDIIISDNRLGFRASITRNIYLTHQVTVLGSNAVATFIGTWIHKKYYNRFSELWIPDHEGENSLGGKLSKRAIVNKTQYIGPVSRLEKTVRKKKYENLIILSGPEPQRTKLEKILIEKFHNGDQKVCLVRGTVEGELLKYENIDVFNFVDGKQLSHLIAESDNIICRSGYTSIMDLVALERGALLIPTTGQTEQEYLAKHLDGKYGFTVMHQNEF